MLNATKKYYHENKAHIKSLHDRIEANKSEEDQRIIHEQKAEHKKNIKPQNTQTRLFPPTQSSTPQIMIFSYPTKKRNILLHRHMLIS
jgi:hypothetical protein